MPKQPKQKTTAAKDTEILAILKNVSLFKDFRDDETELRKIIPILKQEKFKSGNFILREGEEGNTLYILVVGKVTILKDTLEDESYTIVNLEAKDTFNPFFGELALLDSDKRSATIQALTDCSTFVISREDFIKFGNENPKIGLAITREISIGLGQRLRKANKEFILLFEALVSEVDEERRAKTGHQG